MVIVMLLQIKTRLPTYKQPWLAIARTHRKGYANMEFNSVIIILSVTIAGVVVRAIPGPYQMDIQANYLSTLLDAAKERPTVNGELNFSPDKKEFSNIVRSVAGQRGNNIMYVLINLILLLSICSG